MVRSGTVGEGVASRSKYTHTFRNVYIHINLNIVFCLVIQKCVFEPLILPFSQLIYVRFTHLSTRGQASLINVQNDSDRVCSPSVN